MFICLIYSVQLSFSLSPPMQQSCKFTQTLLYTWVSSFMTSSAFNFQQLTIPECCFGSRR